MVRKIAGMVIGVSLIASAGSAQDSSKLSLLIPTLYGPSGLNVDSKTLLPDGSTHSAHFNSAFQAEFTQFNIALASQLAAIPLPSPASGFTYTFDSSLGVFQRSTQSFGPILTERAETIGKGKLSSGISYQYFSFDSLEGVDLERRPGRLHPRRLPARRGPLRRRHDDERDRGERQPVGAVRDLRARQPHGLVGGRPVRLGRPEGDVGRRPFSASGRRPTSPTHYFDDGSGSLGSTRTYAKSGQASGIGDLVVRLKGTPVHGEAGALALGFDVRFPTGDEQDFLGLGAYALRPFMAASFSHGRAASHINVAYVWNGKSVLAGDPATGTKEDMPDQVTYAVGLDVGATKRLTLAFDFLGTYVMDSPRMIRETFTAANGQAFQQIGFVTDSYNMANGAVGLKFNPAGKLLIDLNLLFKLDSSGLRDKLTPLVGIEYAF